MMNSSNRNAMLLLASMWLMSCMSGFHISVVEGIGVHSQKTVNITNVLSDGYTLALNCKSKNNDLGAHNLKTNDFFAFTFKPDFWGRTLYFCKFQWSNKSYWYDIYDYKRDKKDGPNYIWGVDTGAICLNKADKTLRCHSWE
jgi:hypothetical protein